ncbi:glutamine amidotransferase-related protein [Hyphococcus luteus]|uniref:GMP synthase n=1 Tax=Hyphococcus luteus TaxID=2058213 RepID=A0A2S7K3L2_9PROT|nr:GMP synthase [Marinicaulis flavus]PQA87093.1 GMP synthase [Marinicaulis flavus]
MQIRILVTGEPPEPLKSQYGDYPAMFERLISPYSARLSFSATDVTKGEPIPAISDFDGLLITGSPAGVYDGHDWIAPCADLVRRTAEAGKPQVGICFGHQLMAQAFGGKAEKSGKGWGVGVHDYKIAAQREWMDPPSNHIACAVSHQDQVTELPKGAQILGGSEFCPMGVLDFAQGPAISFQQHPEFGHDYGEALLRLRKGRIPAERADPGIDSYKGRSDRALMGKWIANFFLQHGR